MDLFLKIIILSAIIVVVPLGAMFFYRKRIGLGLKIAILSFVGAAIFIGYPVVSFCWAVKKISPHFPEDCSTAKKLSIQYAKSPFSEFHSNLIGKLIGETPKLYFLSTTAICEYKLGNKKETVKALEELMAYAEKTPYGQKDIKKYQNLLNKTRKEINQ